jgi:hypothetical protein
MFTAMVPLHREWCKGLAETTDPLGKVAFRREQAHDDQSVIDHAVERTGMDDDTVLFEQTECGIGLPELEYSGPTGFEM